MTTIIVGGGPAGYFAAIACASATPGNEVVILERSRETLAKLALSGGGRCNLTNTATEPQGLTRCYPRGGRELAGALARFGVADTMAWFEAHGVPLKVEADGRVFPASDKAGDVVGCLRREAKALRVPVRLETEVTGAQWDRERQRFVVQAAGGLELECDRLVIATGGGAGEVALRFGHQVTEPVPALFGLRCADPRVEGLAGTAVEEAEVRIEGERACQRGAVLITHEGLSGPAVLQLSSRAARALHAAGYRVGLLVNWAPAAAEAIMRRELAAMREKAPRTLVSGHGCFGIPQRLWRSLALAAGCRDGQTWAHLSSSQIHALVEQVHRTRLAITGRSLNKEEFVTCGGVALTEVDMRTMQSRLCPGLYFAGEVLDIDGLTGGFNLQAAWTTGWLAGRSATGADRTARNAE